MRRSPIGKENVWRDDDFAYSLISEDIIPICGSIPKALRPKVDMDGDRLVILGLCLRSGGMIEQFFEILASNALKTGILRNRYCCESRGT